METLFRPEVLEHRNHRLHGEVLLSQPRSTRIYAGVIFLTVSAMVTWLVFGSYARIETAPGILVTDKPSPKISATLGGVITELPVREGALVKKGDTLAVVAVELPGEDGRAPASVGIASIDARIALGGDQSRIQRQKHLGERDRLRNVVDSTAATMASLDSEITLQQQLAASSKEMYEKAAEAISRGFVSKVELEARRQRMIEAQQGLATLQQQRLAQKTQGEQAQLQLTEIDNDIASDSVEIATGMQALKQQRAQLEGAKSYILKAPSAGRVTALRTGIGNTASPNMPLMSIVPDAATLQAEVYVPSRAIGFVRPGQEARLEYDAFPFQRFGSAKGTIASVSRIIIDPRESLIPVKIEEPVYKVVIALDRQSMQAFGQQFPLQPGMALQANLVLERQSFLDWLLTPVRAVRNRT